MKGTSRPLSLQHKKRRTHRYPCLTAGEERQCRCHRYYKGQWQSRKYLSICLMSGLWVNWWPLWGCCWASCGTKSWPEGDVPRAARGDELVAAGQGHGGLGVVGGRVMSAPAASGGAPCGTGTGTSCVNPAPPPSCDRDQSSGNA